MPWDPYSTAGRGGKVNAASEFRRHRNVFDQKVLNFIALEAKPKKHYRECLLTTLSSSVVSRKVSSICVQVLIGGLKGDHCGPEVSHGQGFSKAAYGNVHTKVTAEALKVLPPQ